MPDSTIPAEWFAQGDLDVQAAEVLLDQNGPYPVGVTTPLQRAAVQADLNTAHDLIALIRRKAGP